jgi:hypothetical protein
VYSISFACLVYLFPTCVRVGYLFPTCVWGAENVSPSPKSYRRVRGSYAQEEIGAKVFLRPWDDTNEM